MRILHISTRLILGGSQENTVLSCEGQARDGHEVHLAFGPIHGPEGSLLARVERFNAEARRDREIGLHVVPHLVREVSPIADWRAGRELRALIRRLDPDIVHTHSSKAGILGRSAAWAVREGGSRPGIVHTIHGPPFMPEEGGVLARLRTRAMNHAYSVAERRAARRCDAIVSVADAMTRTFRARGIGRPEQYVTVYSGMEVGPFLDSAPGETREAVRAGLGFGPDDFVVGTVARLAPHKGHEDLLDALGPLLTDRAASAPRVQLLWVGDGWWHDRLIARARESGVTTRRAPERDEAARLVLTGLVPPEQVPGLVRAMDVLAHPSTREGLPRTVPQALLCGVCPVAYDVDGTGEACREMETGRLVRAGDRAGLGAAIRWCLEHPRDRAELAARGREWCRERFDARVMVRRLVDVYARAMQRAESGVK